MMRLLFFLSMAFICYTYLGYPAGLYVRSKLFSRPVKKRHQNQLTGVSVVIAARNEAATMERRLANLIEIHYPVHLFEVLVVSDGSDDCTNQIVKQFANRHDNITLIHYEPSRGKPYALNKGVMAAKGEIIVFTDSRQRFDADTVAELTANFSDSAVGCVSGELIFVDSLDSTIQKEMGAYWHFEKWIRKMESRSGSVPGATGAVYAVRKRLYNAIPEETILDDVLIPMTIVMQGYRCVFDPAARAYDAVSKDMASEITRKIRTLAGNWQLLKIAPTLLMPQKNPIWWGFLSHKIFRLIVPFMMICLLFSNLFLWEPFFVVILICQILFYGLALYAWIRPQAREKRPVNLIYFFVNLNYAALMGAWYFFSGNIARTWKKA
ncbi:MAG: glycosyltransferase family 2 protein [Desulfotignum sp.]|nr:glycosyltransferase family 2 protein [Desulfotignum sp.]MCF8088140.1 glycosyltransferase family 2 protein [Desulfotignum sp.]MCF8135800.1 glycosyltransferase family 2 protein [Desulfotignum sp.]